MFGLQSLALLLIWIGYGFVLRPRLSASREAIQRMDRGRRAGLGAGMFVLAAVVLLGGLFAIQSMGGLATDGFHWWAFGAIAALGLIFVHLQVLAAVIMITLMGDTVTPTPQSPSTKVEHDPREP